MASAPAAKGMIPALHRRSSRALRIWAEGSLPWPSVAQCADAWVFFWECVYVFSPFIGSRDPPDVPQSFRRDTGLAPNSESVVHKLCVTFDKLLNFSSFSCNKFSVLL